MNTEYTSRIIKTKNNRVWVETYDLIQPTVELNIVQGVQRIEIEFTVDSARLLLAELTTALAVIAPEAVEDNEPEWDGIGIICDGCGKPDVAYINQVGKAYHIGCEQPTTPPTDEDTQPLRQPDDFSDYIGVD